MTLGSLWKSSEPADGAPAPAPRDVGEELLRAGKIAAAPLERARQLSRQTGSPVGEVIARLGLVSEREIAETLGAALALKIAPASAYPAAPVLPDRFSAKFLKEARMIPLEDRADGLLIALVDPYNSYALDAARFAAKKPVVVHIAYPSDFETAYARLYGDGRSEIGDIAHAASGDDSGVIGDDIQRLQDSASDAPIIRLVNLLIARAVEARASDIHIEPMESELRIRHRIDGVLHVVESPPPQMAAPLISRIKIMARLNIAERRLPQDGRIKLAVRGRDIDFRVSTTPTTQGESVVLRILDRTSLALDYKTLGFDERDVAELRRGLAQPHGIVLVTGPTGSGKTTTLYAALNELNSPEKKILTIEDPVEYQIKGINQVQVKPQIGHDFANALRSFLRQDPDIMMVGEIRDLETAQVAIQSALTGHLILSTVHTNDAASCITRLLDMGVEAFLITSTVNSIVAQRLVRTLCPKCRGAYTATSELIDSLNIAHLCPHGPPQLFHPVGCPACGGTGYLGRSAIIEVLTLNEEIHDRILARASASAIEDCAVRRGMRTMYDHGMAKAIAGLTSVEEVVRVARLN